MCVLYSDRIFGELGSDQKNCNRHVTGFFCVRSYDNDQRWYFFEKYIKAKKAADI